MAPPRGKPANKVQWPPNDELVAMYWSMGFRGIGRSIGCSVTAVHRRFRMLGITPRNSKVFRENRLRGMSKRNEA